MGKEVFVDAKVSITKQKIIRPVDFAFECARCKRIVYIQQDIFEKKMSEPLYCDCDEGKKGVFIRRENKSKFIDYQEISVYDEDKKNQIKVILQEDLVNTST